MLTERTRRQSFPSLTQMTYLNSAAEGIPPLEVHAALNQYFRRQTDGHGWPRMPMPCQYEAVKALTARLIRSEQRRDRHMLLLVRSLQPGRACPATASRAMKSSSTISTFQPEQHPGCSPTALPLCAFGVQREGALHVEDLVPLLTAAHAFGDSLVGKLFQRLYDSAASRRSRQFIAIPMRCLP